MSLREVARFSDFYEAELAAAFLTERGIDVVVADRHLSTMDPLMQRALGGLRLMTPATEIDNARDLLKRAAMGEFAVEDEAETPGPKHRGGLILSLGVLATLALGGGYSAFAVTGARNLNRPVKWI